MCGYCIEYNFLTEVKTYNQSVFQFIENKEIIYDDFYFYYYIQEFDNLSDIFKMMSKFDRFKNNHFFLGRIIDEYVHKGFDVSLVDMIDASYNFKNRGEYLQEQNDYDNNQLLFDLYNLGLYTDEKVWNEFFLDKNLLISRFNKILDFYYDWLFGDEDFIKSHPVDYILLTLNVFFALAYLTQCGTELESITKIALNSPPYPPGPYAEELWIQRKAFLYCYKIYGVEFILQNYKQYIRPELIYYIILKTKISDEDLCQLKNLLMDDLDQSSFYMDIKDVLELIA